MNRVRRGEMPGRSPLRALIFDLDGTIADTEEVHRRAFSQAFAEHGLSWAWSPGEYAGLLSISGGRERILHYARQSVPPPSHGAQLIELARRLHSAKSAHYARMLADRGVPLRPGVLRLLNEARCSGIRLAIASSTSPANVLAVCDGSLPGDWADWFDAVATCEVVEAQKPSPAVYRYVLDHTGWKAGECVAIEDTPNGNRAALSAGLATVITTHAFTRDGDFDGASLVVDGLGDPDRPFKVIAGNAYGCDHLDVGLLGRIVSAAQPHGSEYVTSARCPALRRGRVASVAGTTSTG
ncbi:MAG: HAD-IA family hydrolase [Gammaproteobacteria bacterium]